MNLKECRTPFSAGNEILFELTGTKKKAYEGLDGVFEGIWVALEEYPAWTVLILDEIDQIRQDSNYDPNEFFYRLLRGEGKLAREIQLSIWVLSNELLEVDLRLDSRVESVMSDESVFFPSYGVSELAEIVVPRLGQAFQNGVLPGEVVTHGVTEGAKRWGDARKTLTLFRQAGETAAEDGCETVTTDHIEANIELTERADTIEKLRSLPANQFMVLACATHTRTRDGRRSMERSIKHPVTTTHISEVSGSTNYFDEGLEPRTVRSIVDDLEMAGFLTTWVESHDGPGRGKWVETTFEPEWVRDTLDEALAEIDGKPDGDESE